MNFSTDEVAAVAHFHTGEAIYVAYPTCIVASNTDGDVLFRTRFARTRCMVVSFTTIFVGTDSGKLLIVSGTTGSLIKEVDVGAAVRCLAVDASKQVILAGLKDGSIAAWDLDITQRLWTQSFKGDSAGLGPHTQELNSPIEEVDGPDYLQRCKVFESGLPAKPVRYVYLQFLGVHDKDMGYIGINRMKLFPGKDATGEAIEYTVVSADGSYEPDARQKGHVEPIGGGWWAVSGSYHDLMVELPELSCIGSIGLYCANAGASPSQLVVSAGATAEDAKLADPQVNAISVDEVLGNFFTVTASGYFMMASTSTGEVLWKSRGEEQLTAVTVHSQLGMVFTGGAQGTLAAWQSDKRSLAWTDDLGVSLKSLAVSEEKLFAAVCDTNECVSTVASWKAESGEKGEDIFLKQFFACIDFEPLASLIIIGTRSGGIQAYSSDSGELVLPKKQQKAKESDNFRYGYVKRMAMDARLDIVFTSNNQGSVSALTRTSGDLLWSKKNPEPMDCQAIVASPIKQLLLIAYSDTRGILYPRSSILACKSTSGEELYCVDLDPEQGYDLLCMTVDPLGDRMFYGRRNGSVAAHAVATGEQLWIADPPPLSLGGRGTSIYVPCIAFEPSSAIVFSGRNDGTLKGWCAETGALRWQCKASSDWVESVAADGKRRLIYTGDGSGEIRAWQSQVGDTVWTLKLSDVLDDEVTGGLHSVLNMAFHEDLLFAGLQQGYILALGPDDGALLKRFPWHFGHPVFCTDGGLLVSVCVDAAVLDVKCFSRHGVVVEKYGSMVLPETYEQWIPIDGSWGLYALEAAMLAVSCCQMLAFTKYGYKNIAREQTFYDKLTKLQEFGIDISSFSLFADPFLIAYSLAMAVASLYVGIVYFKDFGQVRVFAMPRTKIYQLFKTMPLYCKLTAKTGFLPIMKILLQPVVCVDNGKGQLVMHESKDAVCGQWKHVTYCLASFLVSVPFVYFVIRLADSDFSLESIQVNHSRPWDRSGDAIDKMPLRRHPLTSKDEGYIFSRLTAKFALILSVFFFVDHSLNIAFLTTQVCIGVFLLSSHRFVEPYFPGQTKHGRYVEPNTMIFALDFITVFGYFCVLVLELLDGLGISSLKGIGFLPFLSLLAGLSAYGLATGQIQALMQQCSAKIADVYSEKELSAVQTRGIKMLSASPQGSDKQSFGKADMRTALLAADARFNTVQSTLAQIEERIKMLEAGAMEGS